MSVYPGAIDSDATLYVAKDYIQGSLLAAQGISDTVAVLHSSTGWVPNMILSVDVGKANVEQQLVTAVVGNVLTVTRGFGGTTASAHAANAIVACNVDAAYQSASKAAIIAIESAIGPNPVVNVQAYGAKGDGTTNDTAAFAAAFAAVGTNTGSTNVLGTGGGTVYVPPGNYVATVVVPSGVSLRGSGLNSTTISAVSNGVTILATAPRSAGILISDLSVYLNEKQGCTAIDIVSTQGGTFRNLRVIGGGDLGPGAITGIAMRIRSAGVTNQDIVLENTFDHINLGITPSQGLVIGGNNDGSNRPVTLCTFYDLRIDGTSTTNPLINVIGNSDTMTMYRVCLGQAAGGYGFAFNTGNPTTDNNVSGWAIYSLSAGDGGTAAPLLFNFCNYMTVYDYECLAPTKYVTTNSPVNILLDTPVGWTNISGKHIRTWKSLGGIHIGAVGDSSFLAFPVTDVALVNGANENVNIKEGQFVRISGPTGAFSIGGLTNAGDDGRPLTLVNMSGQAMTIKNNSSGSTTGYKILTLTGGDVTLRSGNSAVTLAFSLDDNFWLVVGTN